MSGPWQQTHHSLNEPQLDEHWFFDDTQPGPPEHCPKLRAPAGFVRRPLSWPRVLQTHLQVGAFCVHLRNYLHLKLKQIFWVTISCVRPASGPPSQLGSAGLSKFPLLSPLQPVLQLSQSIYKLTIYTGIIKYRPISTLPQLGLRPSTGCFHCGVYIRRFPYGSAEKKCPILSGRVFPVFPSFLGFEFRNLHSSPASATKDLSPSKARCPLECESVESCI